MGRKTAVFEWMPDMTPWEKLAEAVYILKVIQRNCTKLEALVLETYFLGATNLHAKELAKKIGRELHRDRWFTFDILQAWARERPRHSTKWWAKKYGVGPSTIHRWKTEIEERVDLLLQAALVGANHALKNSGHVTW
tara:strand:+ start:148 stop:558 length:411 start_codon:yes stop_codon:yes gene_type:complete